MPFTYKYPRPAVTADAILHYKENGSVYILLIQRAFEPFKDLWALPGGFIELDEELETACSRELEEETGITGICLHQFATFGTIGRDPRGRTISVVFWAETLTMTEPTCGDDAANAQWFNINNLPGLAFDHLQIIQHFRNEILIEN